MCVLMTGLEAVELLGGSLISASETAMEALTTPTLYPQHHHLHWFPSTANYSKKTETGRHVCSRLRDSDAHTVERDL